MNTEHPPTADHNYSRKVAALVAGLNPGPGGAYAIDISHDKWCDLLHQRGFCNCDPMVLLVLTPQGRLS